MSYKVFHLFVILVFAFSLNFVPANTAFAAMPQAAASNLVVNGDFEAGNTGFTSGYTFGPIGQFAGVYEMLTDPLVGHPAATSFRDHTSGAGLMMAINGAQTPGMMVWSQSVSVATNTDYEFSAWVATWVPASPAGLQFRINGNLVGSFTAPATAGVWQKFAVTWNSGASNSANIEIVNLNPDFGGNDFALDDIVLRGLTCPTGTPTNTPGGPPTGTSTNTPTNTSTNTPTSTPTGTPSSACGPNLTVNGDFEAGNTGFTSGYTFGPIGQFAGVYEMLTDPLVGHPAATSFRDHTSGAGLMMAINGAESPGIIVWSQSVPVATGTDYELSVWVATWVPVSPAQLEFRINGSQVGTFIAPITAGVWQKFAATWNSGTSAAAMIEIINLNADGGGNDFALDDIALRGLTCNGPTSTPTNTPTGSTTGTPTNTATSTPTGPGNGTPTNTPTATQTPTSEMGQLKICKVAGTGVALKQLFTFTVGGNTYNVPAGYCILAGQFSLNTKVTIEEIIPAGYFVSKIDVKPVTRKVSTDQTHGQAVVQIGGGTTEVIFTNFANGAPTPTPTPSGSPTPTSSPKGLFQICKEASGAGVTGNFTFRFESRTRTVPVGACSSASWADAGTLTITEDARTGYVVSDIYTIPANRLISKDLNGRKVTVTIVQGTVASETVIVFVNRAVTSAAISDVVANVPQMDVRLSENALDAFMQLLSNSVRD